MKGGRRTVPAPDERRMVPGRAHRSMLVRWSAAAGVTALLALVPVAPAAAVQGGTQAPKFKYPSMVSLHYKGSHSCGGTLYNGNTVVTAAHCVIGDPADFTVHVGSNDRTGGQVMTPVAVHRNPLYNRTTGDGDVATLILAQPVATSASVQPVTLPAQGSDPAPGTAATITGWGSTGPLSLTEPRLLREAGAPVISRAACQQQYPGRPISVHELCASKNGESACRGDGGDPLVVGGTLIGVESFHQDSAIDPGQCRNPSSPDVYVNVGQYVDWINANSA